MSCGDLVLVCESTEDLFPAYPVLGEVDLRWPGAALSRRELAEGTVRPGCVVVPQVLGQHPSQVVLQPSSVARVTVNTSPHRRRGTSRDSAASYSRSAGW